MKKLHQVPYGDVLVDFLYKIKHIIQVHVHSYPGLPALEKDPNMIAFNELKFENILSENVRIS